MKRSHVKIPVLCLAAALGLWGLKAVADRQSYPRRLLETYQKQQTTEILSKVFHVDRIYKSMRGPKEVRNVYIRETEEPELLWVTGFETAMVDKTGEKVMPPEFMCHSNLDFGPSHRYRHDYENARLFTLSQGQLTTIFPQGFGIPVYSRDALRLITQVLNLNYEDREFELRHKVRVYYIRDKDLKIKMRPLFMAGAQAMKNVRKTPTGYEEIDDDAICTVPRRIVQFDERQNLIVDDQRQRFRAHWTVHPGEETVRTDVTGMLKLPYDTTVHYIAVHLHPFAESLELIDVTRDETIFKSNAVNAQGRTGLERVESFTSQKGIRMYKDHEYHLISRYNNTTPQDQDSMAVMYLYLSAKGR